MRVNKGGKRAPYNTKPVELRGVLGHEARVIKSFWTQHTMDQVISMTQEELVGLNPDLSKGVEDGMLLIVPAINLIFPEAPNSLSTSLKTFQK